MGDVSLSPEYKAPHIQVQKEHAVNALIRLSNEHAGNVHIIALGSYRLGSLVTLSADVTCRLATFSGPLSNIALATAMDPTFATKVATLFIMGGTHEHTGNVGLISEFNMYDIIIPTGSNRS